MKHNPFKITESEKNRIKSLHEVVKYKPQIDSTLNYATTHVITEDDGGSTTSPQCGSRLTCCNASGQPYCPTGTPKSCPNNNYGYTYDPKTKSCTKGRGQKWHCEGGNCSKHPSGQYNSESSCEKACRGGNTSGGSECCCKNRETGQVSKKVMRGDKPCTCKAGWIQVKCESNTSGSGCCCNCEDGTNTPMNKDGACPELSHIKPWTGPCDGKGCEQACKGFAPKLYSESTYELPIRYGKRRMSESQLVKMIRRISEEKEYNEMGLNEGINCGLAPGSEGDFCTCCETNSEGEETGCNSGSCAGGQCDCSGSGMIDTGGGVQLADAPGISDTPGKTKGRGSVMGGAKLNERRLTNIIRKVMFESQLLNEIENCGEDSEEGEACTCCGDDCKTGVCPGGGGACDCSGSGMISGGGGYYEDDYALSYDDDYYDYDDELPIRYSRGRMNESQLLTEKVVCDSHADCPSGSQCYYWNDGSGRQECCAGWDRKTGCNEVNPESTTGGGDLELAMGTGRGSIMGGAKLNERKLTNIIRKVMSESQLLNEKPTVCGVYGGSSSQCNNCCHNYVTVGGGNGSECGDCCGSSHKPSGCGDRVSVGGEYEEYDDYHTARGSGGDCAGRTCTGEAGGECGGNGCVCDGEGLCNKGDGRTIRQQTSRRY